MRACGVNATYIGFAIPSSDLCDGTHDPLRSLSRLRQLLRAIVRDGHRYATACGPSGRSRALNRVGSLLQQRLLPGAPILRPSELSNEAPKDALAHAT